MRMQAVFNDTVIADSADTLVVEGNHYFPHDSLRSEYMRPSRKWTLVESRRTTWLGHPDLVRELTDRLLTRRGVG